MYPVTNCTSTLTVQYSTSATEPMSATPATHSTNNGTTGGN
jgi:hypothetical protein